MKNKIFMGMLICLLASGLGFISCGGGDDDNGGGGGGGGGILTFSDEVPLNMLDDAERIKIIANDATVNDSTSVIAHYSGIIVGDYNAANKTIRLRVAKSDATIESTGATTSDKI